MSKVFISPSNLSNIANAIRSQNGQSTHYTPAQMVNAINNIEQNEVYFTSDGRAYAKNMVMPSTVTSIKAQAFKSCTALRSMTMSNAITNLYLSEVFAGCTNLNGITLPSNASGTVGTSFFQNCTSLETITIPQGITTLYQSVFQGCTSLNTVVLPNGFTSFGYLVFYNCTSLETIHLPASVVSVPNTSSNNTFRGCSNLKNVTLGDGFLADINLSASTRFTANDIMNMFNNLGDVPSGENRTFTLGAVNLAKLSDAQKLVATSRGWTLA